VSHVNPKSVEVRALATRSLAHIHHVGPFAGDVELFGRLFGAVMAWARPQGLVKTAQTELITIYHDDSRITEAEHLRISVGLTVPPATRVSGDIRLLEIPAGDYICATFEIDPGQYGAAWNTVRDELLPQHKLRLGDGPCYECYLNDALLHPLHKHVIEIRMSVKPLAEEV